DDIEAAVRAHGSKAGRRWNYIAAPRGAPSPQPNVQMKTLALVLAMIFAAGMSWADDGDAPLKPPPFRPWQEVWQCNDVRVTVTSRSPEEIEYDLGGMIWGGSRFTGGRGNLFFNCRLVRDAALKLKTASSTLLRLAEAWSLTCRYRVLGTKRRGCAKAVNVSSRLRCLRTKTGTAASAVRPF